MAVSPNGTEIAVVNEDRGQTDSGSQLEYNIFLWNTNINSSRFFAGSETRISQVIYSPDGSQIAIGNETGAISLWEITTRQKIYEIQTECGIISSLVFDIEGKTLVCGGENGITLVDSPTGKIIVFFSIPKVDQIQAMAFSTNGAALIATDSDGDVLSLDVNPQSWKTRACQIVGRNFTTEEWDQYIGGEFHSTCADITESRVIVIIDELLGVDGSSIMMSTMLVKDLETDCLDIIEILMAIEDQFEIEISDEEVGLETSEDSCQIAEGFDISVGDIVEFIEQKQ
jgi:acyl carrier protein